MSSWAAGRDASGVVRVHSTRSFRSILGILSLAVAISGCEPIPRVGLIVATGWPAAERRRIEEGFDGWLRSQGKPPVPIRWFLLSAGDDLVGLGSQRQPPDVLLGGPADSYRILSRSRRLVTLEQQGSADWAVSKESTIAAVSASGRPPAIGDAVAFDDPRDDPISLAWATSLLAGDHFRDGYARLVRCAAADRRIGRIAGSAAAAAGRGEIDVAIGIIDDDGHRPADAVPWIEGVAVVAAGSHRDAAADFIAYLRQAGRLEPAPAESRESGAGDLKLLADLLGSTLVDAQDELWLASEALGRAGSPPGPRRWMTEPPPWPPASIARILEREGDQAMAMLETLAGQVATDPEARAWLRTSWLAPSRLIDRALLSEIAHVDDGRLVRDPRFRAWLRAEWTAWARQRYRRVARVAEVGSGPFPSASSSRPGTSLPRP